MGIQRVKIVQSLEGRFEESVIAYLFLVNILPLIIVPLIWCETGKFAAVLNDWSDFEVRIIIFGYLTSINDYRFVFFLFFAFIDVLQYKII